MRLEIQPLLDLVEKGTCLLLVRPTRRYHAAESHWFSARTFHVDLLVLLDDRGGDLALAFGLITTV